MKKKIICKTLKSLLSSEIQLTYHELENILPITASKFGGKPALPENFSWPYYYGKDFTNTYANRPLSFIFQINLSEIAKYDTKSMLPHNGILSFFYDLDTMQWGYEPEDKGCFQLFYFEDSNHLVTTNIPTALEDRFILPELKISFEIKPSLPSFDCIDFGFKYDYKLFNKCQNKLGYFDDDFSTRSKFFGYPDILQSTTMEKECEMITNSIYSGCTFSEITNEQNEKLNQAAKDWILLFQLGTIEAQNKEFMFGSCGHIYVWIKKQDLKNKNFDKSWLILQCT